MDGHTGPRYTPDVLQNSDVTMRLPALAVLALLIGCSGSDAPTQPPTRPAAGAKEAKEAKARKPKKAPAAEEGDEAEGDEADDASHAPIVRTARFTIPVKDASDPAAIAKVVHAAWEKSAKEADAPESEAAEPKAWKCRKVGAWEVAGANDPTLVLYERLNTTTCDAADAAAERWELGLRYAVTAKPEERGEGGKLRFVLATQDFDREADAWRERFGLFFRQQSTKEAPGAFPHDDAWLKEQLPEGVTLGGKKGTAIGSRWALGTLLVAGEKVTVELERLSCDGKTPGAEVVFRTNKRGPGHTNASPKDVMVTEKFKAFADAVAAELGANAGGDGAGTKAVLTCGG